MNVRDAIYQRANQRIMRARAVFERFDDASAEREMVGARWNVRDLAGHLVHWTAEAAEQLPRIAGGAAMPDYDLERINDEVYRRNKRMNYVMLLPQLRAAEDRFLAALNRVDPAKLVGETPVRECISFMLLEHYDHHWPGLEAAAKRVGGGE